MFVRQDWTVFRNVNTLVHKAGVPLERLRALVLKEVMDNALDAAPGKKPRYGEENGFHYIEDDGPGIPGNPEQVAALFSIARPLTSTKILRKPSRGALGNGTRVIAGAILASGGELVVHTRGTRIAVQLNDDGTSSIRDRGPSRVKGTRIELKFGRGLPKSKFPDWLWAKQAAVFNTATVYTGASSAYWYDSDSFWELMQAAGSTPVHQFVAMFDGFEGRKGGEALIRKMVAGVADLPCHQLSREHATDLLMVMRKCSKEVSPRKIGSWMSADHDGTGHYAQVRGVCRVKPGRGQVEAHLPFVVEVLFTEKDEQGADVDDDLTIFTNGTPIAGQLKIERRGPTKAAFFGCGLSHRFDRFPRPKVSAFMNITIPYMPITTDGKEPDLLRFFSEIQKAIGRASKEMRASIRRETGSKVTVLEDNLPEAVKKASGEGEYRFSLRQLYYALRPYVLEAQGEEGTLDYNHFCAWVSRYEQEHGEIKGMYRDARGTLYTPHTGETIPIGTLSVEEYKRPSWMFKHVLYIEKEGLFEVLKQRQFPERYDCALLSSKGFASRAVRDLIDLLADTEEEIHVYAIHDADGPGTLIYEALVQETVARRARRIKIHNLGMEPWEGKKMGLQIETFKDRRSKVPVANYVEDHADGSDWTDWLQTHRIELNAMTSPQFIRWLEGKFDALGLRKLIPPESVLREQLAQSLEQQTRAAVTAQLLREGGLEAKVQERLAALKGKLGDVDVAASVKRALDRQPADRWSAPVDKLAKGLVG